MDLNYSLLITHFSLNLMISDNKKDAYTKTWESATDFPTHESVEAVVRADRQYLFEEIRQWLNAVIDAVIAEEIPFAASEGIPADDIQSAIANVKQQLDEAVIEGEVPDGSITEAKLATGAVTNSKIGAGAVTSEKLGSDVHLLEDHSVTQEKLADPAVGTDQLMNYAVTSAKLATDAVTETKLANGCITTSKLADGCVTPAKATSLQARRVRISNGVLVMSGYSGTFTNPNVTSDSAVIVRPEESSYSKWKNNDIRIYDISAGQITFRASTAISDTLYIHVIILN